MSYETVLELLALRSSALLALRLYIAAALSSFHRGENDRRLNGRLWAMEIPEPMVGSWLMVGVLVSIFYSYTLSKYVMFFLRFIALLPIRSHIFNKCVNALPIRSYIFNKCVNALPIRSHIFNKCVNALSIRSHIFNKCVNAYLSALT